MSITRRLAVGLLLPALLCAQSSSTALWPGSRYTVADRDRAVHRGLAYIYRVASDPKNFADWGHDLLWCFYTISATAKDPQLRHDAKRMGRERAQEWRRIHSSAPSDADADEIADLVFGSDAAARLGVPDPRMKRALRRAAGRFSAVDFLAFDPAGNATPSYDVWSDALITTYTGDRYGVTLGASYPDVLRWIFRLRPYPPRASLGKSQFLDVAYAITHIVYTLNGYGTYRLSPDWLPAEFQYLKDYLMETVRLSDAETTGEFLDTLRAFGMTESDPLIQTGVEYVLSQQNPDGSWGDPHDTDVYNRYHSTWTAVDGLRQYRWRGMRLSFPAARKILTAPSAPPAARPGSSYWPKETPGDTVPPLSLAR
ncbi:MAG TPA: hypothetical protein VMB25_20055 [Bryobacteraceae bacterium]|nr:hypothetical protein [Bryobacteraceae bacterium]